VDTTGHCISSTSDVATVTNTDTIFLTAAARGASDGMVLDQSQGAFAPGATTEIDQVSEIEIGIVGQSGHLTIIGTPGFDALRIGGSHNANGGPDFDVATSDGGDVLSNIESPVVGQLELAPRVVRADPGKWAKTTMRWTHPTSWRELREVDALLYRGTKHVATIDVRPHGRRITAHGAVQIMSNRSLVTHSGKAVTARLAMKFPGSPAGASLRVAVQATDRHGRTQLERDAGLIRIAK
jgi:hypothetical protein